MFRSTGTGRRTGRWRMRSDWKSTIATGRARLETGDERMPAGSAGGADVAGAARCDHDEKQRQNQFNNQIAEFNQVRPVQDRFFRFCFSVSGSLAHVWLRSTALRRFNGARDLPVHCSPRGPCQSCEPLRPVGTSEVHQIFTPLTRIYLNLHLRTVSLVNHRRHFDVASGCPHK